MNEVWGAVVVDVQGDFTEWKGGSLAVPNSGEPYVRSVEAATRRLQKVGFLIFATQDWHPPDHISFAVNHPGLKPFDVITVDGKRQVLWPPHCVQGSENARILVNNNLFLAVVKKGQNPAFDSYSGFQDDNGTKTEMDAILRLNSVTHLLIFGIATDYCVRATAADALSAGYQVAVVKDLCRGITPVTTTKALKSLAQQGAHVAQRLEDVL